MITFEEQLLALTLPLLEKHDSAHGVKHAKAVLANARAINSKLELGLDDRALVTVAYAHDIGCHIDRATHHEISAMWLQASENTEPLNEFTPAQIRTMVNAILRHRHSVDVTEICLTVLDQVLRTADMGPMKVSAKVSRAYAYARDKRKMQPDEAMSTALKHIHDKYMDDRKVTSMWVDMYGEYPLDELRGLIEPGHGYLVSELESIYRQRRHYTYG